MNGYQGQFQLTSATIANTAQESSVISLMGFCLTGIYFPAVFSGTALTFEACDTLGGTYLPLKSTTSGSALSYTVGQGNFSAIDPKDFHGVNFLKLKSGSAEGADRTLICALKGF